MRKTLALMVCVLLLLMAPLQAFAEKPASVTPPMGVTAPYYLNLGDSIAYGMSADPGSSYFNLYDGLLHEGPSMNLAVPGAKTDDLLLAMETDAYIRAIKRADIITVSIGGNNLLKPVIGGLFLAYGLEPQTNSLQELMYSINQGGQTVWQEKVALLGASLGPALTQGALQFGEEWPQIYNKIRSINEDASIVALNIYNPIEYGESPELYGLFEGMIAEMNNVLNVWAMAYEGCYVADVNGAFDLEPDAVAFSLMYVNLDIHPTTLGHSIIFEELSDLGNIRAFQPHRLPIAVIDKK